MFPFKRGLRGRRPRPAAPPGGDGDGARCARGAAPRLLESESQRLAHVGSWEWDAARNVVTWSPELYRVYGTRPQDFDGTYEGFLQRVYAPDRERTRSVVAEALRTARPFEYDHRIVREDGAIRMLQTRGGVVLGEGGGVERLVGCCMDVTERWETQQRLEQSMGLLRATLESTGDGIFVVDLAGKVVVCNRRARVMWGLPEALVARGDVEEMIEHVRGQLADPEGFLERERRLWAEPETQGVDTIRFKDGRVFERYTQAQRQGEQVIGRVCSFRDVTRRERALEGLEALTAELERKVAARTEDLSRRTEELARSNAELEVFASAASHDLSSPVRKMGCFAEMLERRAAGKLTAEEAGLVARIRRSAADLERLIADILALSRVSFDSSPLEDVPLDGVIRAVASDLELELHRSGGALTYGPLPVVRGHETLWRRLLLNLIGNAVKFRAGGRPPVVTVRSERLPDGGALICVEDNGIGFDPRYAREVFQPFRRLNASSAYEGHGIGLATCERIARRYGGTISAESEPGKGSTFVVRLPAESLAPRAGS